jgi:hypothetical protein
MAAKPASWNSATTCAFASASSPETKITLQPPASCGSEPSTSAPGVLPAFTTRAPGDEVRDELADVLPWRSSAAQSLVASMTT